MSWPTRAASLIELLHHLEGEIEIDAPLVQPWATGSTDIQGIQHRRPIFKALIELSAVHRAALFLDVSDGRRSEGWSAGDR